MPKWLKTVWEFFAPLVAENGRKGYRGSLGRMALLAVTIIVIYKYASLNESPPEGILTFAGMAFGYNGVKWFSKGAPKVDTQSQPDQAGLPEGMQ